MIAFSPRSQRERIDTRQLFATAFRKQIRNLERGRFTLHVPLAERHRFESRPGMQYHFKPEMFVQLAGATVFSVPGEDFTLGPDAICMIPAGVPHGEIARDGQRCFENVVCCFYNETVAIHVAHADPDSRPIVDDIYFFTSEFYAELVEHLNRIAHLRTRTGDAAAVAIKGLLMAGFALLLAIVEGDTAAPYSETDKVFRCQWLIRNNLHDPSLSVETLAAELRCSANYLSKLFHHQVGGRVIEYINRARMEHATEALRHTNLSVKEIAAACGFSEPNYFARVFRKIVGRSPGEFRAEAQRIACAVDAEPKVVYADHTEHGFGLRPEVLARVEARNVG